MDDILWNIKARRKDTLKTVGQELNDRLDAICLELEYDEQALVETDGLTAYVAEQMGFDVTPSEDEDIFLVGLPLVFH